MQTDYCEKCGKIKGYVSAVSTNATCGPGAFTVNQFMPPNKFTAIASNVTATNFGTVTFDLCSCHQ